MCERMSRACFASVTRACLSTPWSLLLKMGLHAKRFNNSIPLSALSWFTARSRTTWQTLRACSTTFTAKKLFGKNGGPGRPPEAAQFSNACEHCNERSQIDHFVPVEQRATPSTPLRRNPRPSAREVRGGCQRRDWNVIRSRSLNRQGGFKKVTEGARTARPPVTRRF